jgi:ribosome-binding protein aMBF1 (putative translation factor)
MTPAEFTAALDVLGWSKRELVRHIKCDTNLPLAWERGEVEIPPRTASWLAKLARFHLKQPPPTDWRVR